MLSDGGVQALWLSNVVTWLMLGRRLGSAAATRDYRIALSCTSRLGILIQNSTTRDLQLREASAGRKQCQAIVSSPRSGRRHT
jgi:hypothetical protein